MYDSPLFRFSSHDLTAARVPRSWTRDLYASKMGKKIAAVCIVMIPGASLHSLSITKLVHKLERAAYHIGGTQYLLTDLKCSEYRAASHSGVPGSL